MSIISMAWLSTKENMRNINHITIIVINHIINACEGPLSIVMNSHNHGLITEGSIFEGRVRMSIPLKLSVIMLRLKVSWKRYPTRLIRLIMISRIL